MYSLSHSKYYILRPCYSRTRFRCYRRLLRFCSNHIAVQFKGKTKVRGFQTNDIRIFRSTGSLELNFYRHKAEFLCVVVDRGPDPLRQTHATQETYDRA